MEDLEHQVVVLGLNFAFAIGILFERFGPQMRELIRSRLRRVDSSLHLEQSIQMVLIFVVIAT